MTKPDTSDAAVCLTIQYLMYDGSYSVRDRAKDTIEALLAERNALRAQLAAKAPPAEEWEPPDEMLDWLAGNLSAYATEKTNALFALCAIREWMLERAPAILDTFNGTSGNEADSMRAAIAAAFDRRER